MTISRPFILRPIGTTLLMLALLLCGLAALPFLPVSALPDVAYPVIEVRCAYPGASPAVMNALITAPLERQLGQMAGLVEMSSGSGAGSAVITVEFSLGLPLDIAEQEVQAAINAAATLLPADLPTPPVYAKINPADAPVMTVALTAPGLALTRLEDIGETILLPKLAQLPGVGLVDIAGGQRPAIRVRVNPRALAGLGLSLEDVRAALGALTVNGPKGTLDGEARSASIETNDQLIDPAAYRTAIITVRHGAPVHLADIATVVQAAENPERGAWVNGRPAILLEIHRQPGANVIAVANQARALLGDLRKTLPAQLDIAPLADRTRAIRAAVGNAFADLALAILLVGLVLRVFLGTWRAALAPALAVPLSLAGTLGCMHLLGYSLDILSLMALTIATGFVVDDAIVMVENIARHAEAGETPLRAALAGSRQIAFTIVSLTVSLVAVLIPLLFMNELIGLLFREFAVTLAIAIFFSAVISLTLVPMLAARLPAVSAHGGTSRASRLFGRLHGAYGTVLWVILARPRTTLAGAGLTLASVLALALLIPKGLFPTQDSGIVQLVTQAPPGAAYASLETRHQALASLLGRDRDIAATALRLGVDGDNTAANEGRALLDLGPRARRASAAAIAARLRTLSPAGLRLFARPVQDLTLDAAPSPGAYRLVLSAPTQADIADAAQAVLVRLAALPELADVSSDVQQGGLVARVDVDRASAARLGVTPAAIDNALNDMFGQRIVSTVFTQSTQYRVILQADHGSAGGPAALAAAYVPSLATPGSQVPLGSFASIRQDVAPLRENHLDQFPAATLSFDPAPGVSLGAAVAAIETAVRTAALPAGIVVKFSGAAARFQESLGHEAWLILAAIVVMYIVLGVLYESVVHPLTILSTLPSAALGALVTLFLAGKPLDVIGVIGVVLLIGIVKKNAIMMVDFALTLQRTTGAPPDLAIHQAAMLRLRPILMTSFAALLAALPLAFAGGTGAELREPLGLAIIGGLVVSQCLTLFTTPVIYLAFARLADGHAK